MYGIDVSQIQSLKEFNRLLKGYIRKHNTTPHSVTEKSPLERYMSTNEKIGKPKSQAWLEECFHNRLIRRVNRDATVHLMNTVYDAPMQFIGQKVEVRFSPYDPEDVYILHGGMQHPLRLTDRVANGKTKRQNVVQIDYEKEDGRDVY